MGEFFEEVGIVGRHELGVGHRHERSDGLTTKVGGWRVRDLSSTPLLVKRT